MIEIGQTFKGERKVTFTGKDVDGLDFIVELARELMAHETISPLYEKEKANAEKLIKFLQEDYFQFDKII